MEIPLTPYVKAIIENNSFGITGVFYAEEIDTYEYTSKKAEELVKLIETGKFELIDAYPKSDVAGKENMTLIRFKDGDGFLFFALLQNFSKRNQEPYVLGIAKAFFYNIKADKKETLLSEFKKAKNVDQKVQFFSKKLGISYIEFIENLPYYQELREFEFSGYDNKESWKEVNNWIIDTYVPKGQRDPIILKIDQLKKDFKENLSLERKKEEFVLGELRRIEKSFTQHSSKPMLFGTGTVFYTNAEFNADFEAYEDFYKYKKEPDFSAHQPRLSVLALANGKTLAEYRLFVEGELARVKKGKPANEGEQDLSVQQKMLLLHLSGFLDGMKGDNSNKARILAPLMGHGEKSVYDSILVVHSPEVRKNKRNLSAILTFLEQNGEKSIKKLVADELKKLSSNN